jgi:hypothetical protein
MLLPLLWSLVVDGLVGELNEGGCYAVGYSDDIAILINGKFPQAVSEVLQTALGLVQQWCDRTGLSINPSKMVVIPFTKKRVLKGLKELTLFGKTIQLFTEVKYLGLTLDKGLSWGAQLDKVTNRAYRVFWTCKGTFGKAWGQKLWVVHWVYTMVVRPIITYAAMVWWLRLKFKMSQARLSKLQRLACLGVTGAMRTAPTAAIEVFLGLPPLHLKIEAEALAGIYRLSCNEQWRLKSLWCGHMNKAQDMMREPILQMGTDKITPRYAFHKPFTVRLPDRSDWDRGTVPIGKRGLIWYTDGSKTNERYWSQGVWPWYEAEVQLQPRMAHYAISGQSICH